MFLFHCSPTCYAKLAVTDKKYILLKKEAIKPATEKKKKKTNGVTPEPSNGRYSIHTGSLSCSLTQLVIKAKLIVSLAFTLVLCHNSS